MEHTASTTVVIVGDEADAALRSLHGLANVQAESLHGLPDDEAARLASTAQALYLVHDRDPLEHVAGAWTEFFDDQVTLETLQLEIERAIDVLDSGDVAIPDYYVVLHPEELPMTRRHWWLGVVSSASPTRVIPWEEPDAPLTPMLRRLPTGRPWPKHGPWLRGVIGAIPDRVGLSGAA
jgi:hypothetical protein